MDGYKMTRSEIVDVFIEPHSTNEEIKQAVRAIVRHGLLHDRRFLGEPIDDSMGKQEGFEDVWDTVHRIAKELGIHYSRWNVWHRLLVVRK